MTRRPTTRTRPRYGRIAALGGAVAVTCVTALAGAGVLPSGAPPTYAASPGASTDASGAGSSASGSESAASEDGLRLAAGAGAPGDATVLGPPAAPVAEPAVPAGSGSGKRVVFDISEQRVWLVRPDGDVGRTYLVSGSLTDNLQPGSYHVYSRSRHAVGVDETGTMEFMVRFTTGVRAPIGFHSVPVLDGRLLQKRSQLGTPQSHGCVRQWRPDAKALWRFAPLGTSVVVTA